MLKSAAGLIPVPLLRDALDLAIKVIQACEVSIQRLLLKARLHIHSE